MGINITDEKFKRQGYWDIPLGFMSDSTIYKRSYTNDRLDGYSFLSAPFANALYKGYYKLSDKIGMHIILE